MSQVIYFWVIVILIIEYFSFFYIIFRKALRTYSWKRIVYGGIITLTLLCASLREWNITLLLLFGLFISIFVVYLLFEVSVKETIKLYLVAFPALSILESIVEYFFKMVLDFGKIERIIAYMISIVLGLWLYYFILGRKLEREAFQMSGWLWLIISIVMFLLVGMISYFTYVLMEVVGTPQKNMGLLLLTAGGFAIFILMYVMLYYFNTKQKYQLQSDMLEQYNEQQRKYFEELLQKEQSTRQFRHDITSDLLQIQNFYRKNKYKEAKQYIYEMLKEISTINKKGYNVGNEIINTILNSYFAPIETVSDIKVKGFIDNEIKVSQRDLCVVVSNLVKNAVEAVEQCSKELKMITFEANQGKQFLYIKVKNTIGDKNVLIENNYPVTDKGNKKIHGFGIKNVMMVAEKYNGCYKYRIEEGYYIAEVYLQI